LGIVEAELNLVWAWGEVLEAMGLPVLDPPASFLVELEQDLIIFWANLAIIAIKIDNYILAFLGAKLAERAGVGNLGLAVGDAFSDRLLEGFYISANEGLWGANHLAVGGRKEGLKKLGAIGNINLEIAVILGGMQAIVEHQMQVQPQRNILLPSFAQAINGLAQQKVLDNHAEAAILVIEAAHLDATVLVEGQSGQGQKLNF